MIKGTNNVKSEVRQKVVIPFVIAVVASVVLFNVIGRVIKSNEVGIPA